MFAIPRFHLSKSAVLGLSVLAAIAAVPRQRKRRLPIDAQIPFSFSSPTLVSPRGIAVAPDGTVYVADVQSGTTGRVVRITPTTGSGHRNGSRSSVARCHGGNAYSRALPSQRPTARGVGFDGSPLYRGWHRMAVVIEMPSPETSSAATLYHLPWDGNSHRAGRRFLEQSVYRR